MPDFKISGKQVKTFLVGGAVRDLLMSREPTDRDYVVVGATPADMFAAGFKSVGGDFPVFLHPETGDEYALARAMCSSSAENDEFTAVFDPSISIAEDLGNRDFTCNSIAMDEDGIIIDPFRGLNDISAKCLRHTSKAFGNDPVRVLRAARLAAKLGFSIAPETVTLCREITVSGKLKHLTPERVALEFNKALTTQRPSAFFLELDRFGALTTLFPELAALKGRIQPVEHHLEGDAFAHTMMVVDAAACRFGDPLITFGALVHDFGKALTADENLPSHLGHEELGIGPVNALADRLKLSNIQRKIGVLSARFHTHVHRTNEMNAKTFVDLMEAFGGPQHAKRNAEIIASVATSDYLGRLTAAPREAYVAGFRFPHIIAEVAIARISEKYSNDQIKTMSASALQNGLRHIQVAAAKRAMKAAEMMNERA